MSNKVPIATVPVINDRRGIPEVRCLECGKVKHAAGRLGPTIHLGAATPDDYRKASEYLRTFHPDDHDKRVTERIEQYGYHRGPCGMSGEALRPATPEELQMFPLCKQCFPNGVAQEVYRL